jgi:hypothetical protein
VNDNSVGVLKKAGFRQTAREAGKIVFELLDEVEADPDFEEQLSKAFNYPLVLSLGERRGISPEEIAERERYYSRQRLLPDNSPIIVPEWYKQNHEAVTHDPRKFALLIAQAMRRLELAKGSPDPGVMITKEIQKAADHEAAHGKMATSRGLESAYVVRVIYDIDNDIWAIGPAHVLLGPAQITKLESAAISAAPDDASEGDMLSVNAAGYTSREEVMEKLHASHGLV